VADIKFCGLTRRADAEQATALGAAYVGVIFAGGPRMRTLDEAAEVLTGAGPGVRRVGVFADQSAEEIGRIGEFLSLDVVQLHGAADRQRIRKIRDHFAGDIWPVVRVSNGQELARYAADLLDAGDALLLDAFVPGALGGTGVTLPWFDLASTLASVRGTKPIVLAGGLRPENVAQAIGALAPDVVDVSSGVESSAGIKDHDRMRAFRDAVTQSSISI
jgi:phosphoribosylanthranilate isomerase